MLEIIIFHSKLVRNRSIKWLLTFCDFTGILILLKVSSIDEQSKLYIYI
jgi:hypothetical protein